MTSFSGAITSRANTPDAIFHKFRTSATPNSILHLFVEGYEDSALYDGLLNILKKNERSSWRNYICLGKKNMDRIIELYRRSSINDRNVLFIRDSDYDRFLERVPSNDNVFITCGYSVENYVCDRETLKRFILGAFCIDPHELDIDQLIDEHINNVRILFSWMADVIGAVIYASKIGVKLDLDQMDFSSAYELQVDGKPLPDAISSDIWKATGLKEEHFNPESKEMGRVFALQDAVRWTRGKYLLNFTARFLIRLFAHSRDLKKNGRLSRLNKRGLSDSSDASVFDKLRSYSNGTEELRTALSSRLI